MVQILIDSYAYKFIKVGPEKDGINSLPRWLRNCKCITEVENQILLHEFDFNYINNEMLLVIPQNGRIRSNKLSNISFEVVDDTKN